MSTPANPLLDQVAAGADEFLDAYLADLAEKIEERGPEQALADLAALLSHDGVPPLWGLLAATAIVRCARRQMEDHPETGTPTQS